MSWQDRIIIDPQTLAGKPVIRSMRLSVAFVLGLMGQGWSEAAILEGYPGLTREDLAACLQYASKSRDLPARLRALGEHCAALPDCDTRSADEIIGYDNAGVWS